MVPISGASKMELKNGPNHGPGHWNSCAASENCARTNKNLQKNGRKIWIFSSMVQMILIVTFSQPASAVESVWVHKCSPGVGSVVRIPSNWTKLGQPLEFSLKSGFSECQGESFIKVVMPEEDPEFNRTENEHFESNGLVRLGSDYYDTWEYCIQKQGGGRIYIKVCKPLCTASMPCVSKCCSVGKVFEYPNGCVPAPESMSTKSMWRPRMYENPWRKLTPRECEKVKLHVRHGAPKCPNNEAFDFEPLPSVDLLDYGLHRVPMRIRKDGSLLLLGKQRSWEPRPWEQFCTDDLWVNSSNGTWSVWENRPFIVQKCIEEQEQRDTVIPLLYVISMSISAFFLLLTAVVYVLLWDKHNVHGRTISCHVSSMFFLYVFLALSFFLGQLLVVEVAIPEPDIELEAEVNGSGFEYHVNNESEHFVDEVQVNFGEGSTACTVIGAIAHFFFISTFCWLTLLNFDLWSTFKSTKPVGERSRGIVRFGLYNLFAWGFPAVVVAVSFVMDYMYPDAESEVIVPQYGQVTCFIAPWAMGYYVYTIVGILMIINLIFISLTSCIIYRFRQTSQMIQQNRSVAAQQSFKLFSKLFIVMGVSWVFEIVSWLIAGDMIHFVILDFVNICQSIAIFVIFICKQKTYDQLRNKFPWFQRLVRCCRFTGDRQLSSAQSSGTLASSTKQTTLGHQSSKTSATAGKANAIAMKPMSKDTA